MEKCLINVLYINNRPKEAFVLNIIRKTPRVSLKNNLRKHPRINLKAVVKIKNRKNRIAAKGRCINASLGGIGLSLFGQARKILSFKDKLEILIVLPDNSQPIQKSGRIVWYKKIGFFTYRSGIEFE